MAAAPPLVLTYVTLDRFIDQFLFQIFQLQASTRGRSTQYSPATGLCPTDMGSNETIALAVLRHERKATGNPLGDGQPCHVLAFEHGASLDQFAAACHGFQQLGAPAPIRP